MAVAKHIKKVPDLIDPGHSDAIEDVQAAPDSRQLPINRVGIKSIRHPITVKDRSAGEQNTVAEFSMFVSLPHHFKGTHMSRFVEILNGHEFAISIRSFQEMLFEVQEKLEAETSRIEMTFPYFVEKVAPVSGVKSVMDYQVSFVGEVRDGKAHHSLKVLIPATSLCPCSKNISEYGAHNQRAHITVTVEMNDFIWIEEIIEMVEAQASSEVYGVLKRIDEKYVTERAYDNPKFAEDLVRDVAAKFNEDDRVDSYIVEVENFESIHNHSAYAMITRNKREETNPEK